MDRTSIGNFHQSRPLGSGHVARNGDVTGNLVNIAVLGVAIRTILCVDSPVRQAYGEAIGADTLSLGIEAHRHRGTRTEGSEEIIIGAGPRILATNRNRFIRHEQMAPGPYALHQMPAARLTHLNHAVRKRRSLFADGQIP